MQASYAHAVAASSANQGRWRICKCGASLHTASSVYDVHIVFCQLLIQNLVNTLYKFCLSHAVQTAFVYVWRGFLAI